MATTHGKDYIDFDMDFGKHPAHGDLEQVKKNNVISRSINNIIKIYFIVSSTIYLYRINIIYNFWIYNFKFSYNQ